MRDDKLKAIPNTALNDYPFNYKDLINLTSVKQLEETTIRKATGDVIPK